MTLEEARNVEAAARPAARALIAAAFLGVLAIPLALRFAHAAPMRVVLTWAAPLMIVGLLALAWRLRRASPERVNRGVQWTGTIAIAVTATFDVLVTIVMDPMLAFEGNPFVRMLIRGGHSMTFVRIHAATCQALLVAMLAVLLCAVLAHAEPLRILAWGMAPRDRKEFVTAAKLGTTDNSLFFGLRLRDWMSLRALPCAVWIASVLCISSCLARTAFGLEWLDVRLPPALRTGVIVVATILAINAAWARSWRRGPPLGMALPHPGPVTSTAAPPS